MAFSLWLSLRSIIKLTTGQRITLKIRHLNGLYPWARDTVMWHWSADTLFDSCHLTITWMSMGMSTIKLNADCICLGHLASNAPSLQENSQSERVLGMGRVRLHVDYQAWGQDGWILTKFFFRALMDRDALEVNKIAAYALVSLISGK